MWYDFDIQQLKEFGDVSDMSDWWMDLPVLKPWGNMGFKLICSNGFGASIQRHIGTYGYSEGLWEVAVLDQEGNLCYDTPVTDDVLGYLSWDEVVAACREISELE